MLILCEESEKISCEVIEFALLALVSELLIILDVA
jgi:hypothetical protein